jgi:CHAD domain-containing protein
MARTVERFSTEPPRAKALRKARVELPDSAHDVVARYVARQRKELLRCGKAISVNADAEALHDLRVASRRLRAALRLGPAEPVAKPRNRIGKKLRRLGRVLGRPRESDVNVAILENRLPGARPPLAPAIELMLGFEHERRTAARAKMLRRLEKIDLDEIGRRLSPAPRRPAEGRWLLPLDRFAAQQIELARAELEKLWARASERPSDENLHALRIAVKKFRYLVEILAPALVPRRRGPALARLRSLQDLLGDLHDLSVLHREIADRRRFFESFSLSSVSSALKELEVSIAKEIRAGRAAAAARLRGAPDTRFLSSLSAGLVRSAAARGTRGTSFIRTSSRSGKNPGLEGKQHDDDRSLSKLDGL